MIFTCYERLYSVASAVAVEHYANTTAFAREIAGGNAVAFNQRMTQAKACIQPGLNFYQQKFSVQFRDTVRARLCCPMQVQHLRPTAASLKEFRNFPFLVNDNIIANLTRELPDHLAAADDVVMEDEEEKLAWWAANSVRLPYWANQQDNALEDYLCNNTKRQ